MKLFFSILLFAGFAACSSSENKPDPEDMKENPSAIESETQHPNGITGSGVISRDTSAFTVDTTRNKAGDTMRNRVDIYN